MEAGRCRLTLALWMGALLVLALCWGLVTAACYDECDNCSADPAFVQVDRRSPETVVAIREAQAKGYKVVTFEDGTTVIIGDPPAQAQCEGCGK